MVFIHLSTSSLGSIICFYAILMVMMVQRRKLKAISLMIPPFLPSSFTVSLFTRLWTTNGNAVSNIHKLFAGKFRQFGRVFLLFSIEYFDSLFSFFFYLSLTFQIDFPLFSNIFCLDFSMIKSTMLLCSWIFIICH